MSRDASSILETRFLNDAAKYDGAELADSLALVRWSVSNRMNPTPYELEARGSTARIRVADFLDTLSQGTRNAADTLVVVVEVPEVEKKPRDSVVVIVEPAAQDDLDRVVARHDGLRPAVVLLSNPTHIYDAGTNAALLRDAHDVLVPGGVVAIADFVRGRRGRAGTPRRTAAVCPSGGRSACSGAGRSQPAVTSTSSR